MLSEYQLLDGHRHAESLLNLFLTFPGPV